MQLYERQIDRDKDLSISPWLSLLRGTRTTSQILKGSGIPKFPGQPFEILSKCPKIVSLCQNICFCEVSTGA